MAVRKRTPARRKTTTVRKKPASPAAQRKATVPSTGLRKKPTRVRKAPPKTGVKKPTPKVKKATVKKLKSAGVIPKKNITAKELQKSVKTAPKKIKPKGRTSALIAGGAALLTSLGVLNNKPKTFGEAFKKARKNKGPNATFTYKGKKYSTVTKDQIKKAGHSNLRDYLNAQKKKGSSSSRNRRTR